jgi:preprotein translocase subunit SecA
MRDVERYIFLNKLDQHWKDHLAGMDYLKQGIHLHGYAQKNPKQEYKRLAFDMFKDLLSRIQYDTVQTLMAGDVVSEEEMQEFERNEGDWAYEHAEASSAYGDDEQEVDAEPQQPFVREEKKVGRNEPCPCGSGKKYKHCHGRPN